MKALEHLVEGVAPVGVAPRRRSVTALQRGGLKETAVEKRNPAQRPDRRGALVGRAVQRAEAEGIECGMVEMTSPRDRPLQQCGQVPPVAVQPTLLLDEVEEQH